jgi:predicted nucleotidyltransferase
MSGTMDFKVEKREAPKKESKYSKEEIDIAFHFAKSIYKEFDRFLKAIVLFGSSVKETHEDASDIDVLLIVDDVSYYMTPEVVETYRIITERLILRISKKLHVTTIKFTTFWEYVRVGDPIGINILRDGVALIDTGFFTPLQMLLYQGRIRPTKEAVLSYQSRVPQTLYNSKWHIMQGTLDLYWASIDAAHAALMKAGEMPPQPSRVADLLDEKLVKARLIDRRCPGIMRNLYDTSKRILHREIKDMKGSEYDRLQKEADFLCEDLRKYIQKKDTN